MEGFVQKGGGVNGLKGRGVEVGSGNTKKGREMALVWREKSNRTALQTGSLSYDYSQGKCRKMLSIIIKLEITSSLL